MQNLNNLKIKQPIIIIGAPRSGTSLLLTILSASKYLFSQYRETIDIWERFYKSFNITFKNDYLGEKDFSEDKKSFLINEFHKYTFNNYPIGAFIRKYYLNNQIILDFIGQENLIFKNLFFSEYRMVEKSPKSCFRIDFINKIFPDCKFIYLTRDGRSNINSLIEGWNGPNKYSRSEVKNWKFILPPTWEQYVGKPIEEISAFQWAESNNAAIESLKLIPDSRKYILKYENLTNNPKDSILNMINFADIPLCDNLKNYLNKLPEVNYVTKPNKDKWRNNLPLLEKIYPTIQPTMNKMGYELK